MSARDELPPLYVTLRLPAAAVVDPRGRLLTPAPFEAQVASGALCAVRHKRTQVICFAMLVLVAALCATASPAYPELRESYDPKLQAMLDEQVRHFPLHEEGVQNKEFSTVVVDVTDLHRPRVAGYNADLMLYAASLPKIAIVFGALVEAERGVLELDEQTRSELVRTVRNSSNRDATALLEKVGYERLAEILQDERHGKLYDPEHGGGLWVGRAYAKSPAWRRDPLKGLSHAASAMQVARLYYGLMNGTLLDPKYLSLLEEIFGKPGIKHKFVKGLEGREGIEVFRKSGTWRDHHSDSIVVAREDQIYIVVHIDKYPYAERDMVEGIQLIDDMMREYARMRSLETQ